MTSQLNVESLQINAHEGGDLMVGYCLDGDDHRHLMLAIKPDDHPRLRDLWKELTEIVLPEAGALVCGMVTGSLVPDTPAEAVRTVYPCRICATPVIAGDPGVRQDGNRYYCPDHA